MVSTIYSHYVENVTHLNFHNMATDKKSVLLYCDLIHTVEKLIKKDRVKGTNNAGELFYHYLQYINDLHPEPINDIVDLTFEPIKQNLKRDLKKWKGTKEVKSISGREGNLKRWHTDLYDEYKKGVYTLEGAESIAKGRTAIKPIANIAVKDKVNVTGNVIDTDTVNDNIPLDINSRKLKFAQSLNPFMDKYGKPMLEEFIEYWCEHNDKGKKMRFEYAKNQPFNINRRLITWNTNNNKNGNFKTTKSNSTGAGTERQDFN